MVNRKRWCYEALALLAFVLPALPGCETVEKCPPSFLDERPGCTQIPCCSRNRVYVFLIAAVEAPRHLVEVTAKVLRADPVMDADDLALYECPNTFDPVRVDAIVADVFACRMVDGMVIITALQTDE